MDWIALGVIHDRIRIAQLPGYSLHYADGPDTFRMEKSGDNGQRFISREHSAAVLLEWADETLSSIGV